MSKNIKGIIFCTLLAIPAWYLGNFFPIIGGPVFAIFIGMAVGVFFVERGDYSQGIKFTSKKILQYAVILLGFGLNLRTVLEVGLSSFPVIISTILTSLIVAYFLSKIFKIQTNIATLIGVGSSICGGSAIAATAPVIDADDDEIAQAISVIFLFNIVAVLIFPSIGNFLKFSNEGFAIFAGTAINDTSSVTSASSIWDSIHNTGSQVLEKATIVKLTRTLSIIPITLILSMYKSRKNLKEDKSSIKKIFPMFIIYFIICSAIGSITDIFITRNILAYDKVQYLHYFFKTMKKLSKFFIVMAMTAIGLNTNLPKLIKTGTKPIILGGACWISIIIISIFMQKILGLF